MNKIAIIFDPAHGKDTPGKRSPDELHREFLWSRERILGIINIILNNNSTFDIYFPFVYYQNEPGLITRVLKYNDIAKDFDVTFVISIHNDAQRKDQCDKEGWGKANGISIWTSRGETKADKFATNLFDFLKSKYPNDVFRSAYWLSEKEKIKDPDWEANFTILAGNDHVKPNYEAILLEWRFQTNKEDVQKLQDKKHNEYFEDMISQWVINTFNYEAKNQTSQTKLL